MKIACVFGGSGFLGSHVADKLSDAGYKVRIFDLVPSPWIQPDQDMIVGSINDQVAVNKAIEGSDVVYNFAALADLNKGLNNPLDTVRINVLGNAYVMEGCRRFGVQRFVYASTVYVYSRAGLPEARAANHEAPLKLQLVINLPPRFQHVDTIWCPF